MSSVDKSKTESPSKAQETMHVKVHAPYKTYFDGQAVSLTAENDTGKFDILPQHHHFISLLSTSEIVIRTDNGNEETIQIQQGIMHVKSDEVVVFLDV